MSSEMHKISAESRTKILYKRHLDIRLIEHSLFWYRVTQKNFEMKTSEKLAQRTQHTVVTNTNDKNAMIAMWYARFSGCCLSCFAFCCYLLCHGTRATKYHETAAETAPSILARLVLDGVVAGVVVLICHNFYNCLHTSWNVPFDYTRGKTVRNHGSFHVEHIITGHTLSRTHKFRSIDTIQPFSNSHWTTHG